MLPNLPELTAAVDNRTFESITALVASFVVVTFRSANLSGITASLIAAENIQAGTLGPLVIASSVPAANVGVGILGPGVIVSSVAVDSIQTDAINNFAVTDAKIATGINASKLTGILTVSSITATDALGVGAAQLRLSNNVIVSSETNAALGGGLNISTNVYVVGY